METQSGMNNQENRGGLLPPGRQIHDAHVAKTAQCRAGPDKRTRATAWATGKDRADRAHG